MSDAKNTKPAKTPDVGESKEARMAYQAPEMHNDEQDDHRNQAQEVASEARQRTPSDDSPTESVKSDNSSGLMGDSTQDLVDHMRDMESSGRIDMDAFKGEPNHDDEDDKYGKGHDLDEDEAKDARDEAS